MQNNRIPLLAAVLVVLVGVAWLSGVFDREPSTIEVPSVDIPTDEVDRIRVQGPEWTVEVTREGGVWQVVEPVPARADSNAVVRLLDSLSELKLNTVVSTSPDRHGNYGVDQPSARYLTLGWADEEELLLVAEQGPDFSSSYVRLGETPAVYSSSRIALPANADLFRDKTLINLTPYTVRAVDISAPDFAYRAESGPEGWALADGTPLDSVSVSSWLRRFSPLRMDGFRDDLVRDSLSVTHRAVFEIEGGPRLEVQFEEQDEDLLAWSSQGPGVMRSFVSRLGTLIQEPGSLQPPQ